MSDMSTWSYDQFPFMGQAVVLSQGHRESTHQMKGYVVGVGGSNNSLAMRLVDGITDNNIADINRWSVDVMWEDGTTSFTRTGYLLLVDEPIKTIIRYEFNNGNSVSAPEGMMARVDKMVIKKGLTIEDKYPAEYGKKERIIEICEELIEHRARRAGDVPFQ